MKRTALLLAFLCAPISLMHAQQPQPVPLGPMEKIQCLPATTLDELIKALDDAVSGPGNKDRACFRELLLPNARLVPVNKTKQGMIAPHILSVDEWVQAVAQRGTNVFYERQVKFKTEQYGHVAHLWSTYEIRDTPDGKAEVRGINSIQAINDGKVWRVLSIEWETEASAGPVPSQYLP
jgi:hypothetical protein